jgi:hypothetical protein
MERGVAMIGRALIEQPHVSRLRDLCTEPSREARLANAGLAGNQHDLALAIPGATLALEQIGALGLAADEAGQTRHLRGLETALALSYAKRRPGLDRFGETLDDVFAEVAQAKPVAEQASSGRPDRDPARLDEALQPGREIGGVADDGLLPRRTLTDDVADHDEARGDADADGEILARSRLQSRHHFRDFEPGMHRPRCVVLVRAGEPEIGEHAVAHELRDEAVVARHDARHRILIGANDLPHVFGIEARR